MGRLDGKVALISGTARGQGHAAALRFLAEGASVVGGDLLAHEPADPRMVVVDRLDATDEASVAAWVQAAVDAFGRIDVLYANAGAVRFGAVA